jgi:uncharacterized protein YrrD
MLILRSSLINLPVVALQSGEQLAVVSDSIIFQSNLSLVGFWCRVKKPDDYLLLGRDVNFVAKNCVAVDSNASISSPHDIARIDNIRQENYQLIGTPVITMSGDKLGKVHDCAFELDNGQVQKLYVKPSLWSSISRSELIIDRSQIINLALTPRQIIVADTAVSLEAAAKHHTDGGFRAAKLSTTASDLPAGSQNHAAAQSDSDSPANTARTSS